MELLQEFGAQYGYLSVFLFLSLGIFGLPMPDEVIVVFTGYLASSGTFHFLYTVFFTLAGVTIGILFTYALGRKIGKPLIRRFGKYLALSPKRLHTVEKWFMVYGLWLVDSDNRLSPAGDAPFYLLCVRDERHVDAAVYTIRGSGHHSLYDHLPAARLRCPFSGILTTGKLSSSACQSFL